MIEDRFPDWISLSPKHKRNRYFEHRSFELSAYILKGRPASPGSLNLFIYVWEMPMEDPIREVTQTVNKRFPLVYLQRYIKLLTSNFRQIILTL